MAQDDERCALLIAASDAAESENCDAPAATTNSPLSAAADSPLELQVRCFANKLFVVRLLF